MYDFYRENISQFKSSSTWWSEGEQTLQVVLWAHSGKSFQACHALAMPGSAGLHRATQASGLTWVARQACNCLNGPWTSLANQRSHQLSKERGYVDHPAQLQALQGTNDKHATQSTLWCHLMYNAHYIFRKINL